MPGIQSVAYGAAGKQRQAYRIADGEGAEAAGGQAAHGQRDASEAAGRPLVAEQDDEAEGGRAQGAEQRRPGHVGDGIVEGAGIDLP